MPGAIPSDQLSQACNLLGRSPQFSAGRHAHRRRRGQDEVRWLNTLGLDNLYQPFQLVKHCLRSSHPILLFKIVRPQRDNNGPEGRMPFKGGA